MIRIDDRSAKRGDPAMEAPGGFVWWYLDLVGPEGDGIVVIWSYGLPFLPGYASAARRGEAARPVDRPSLNVAVYDDGELDCYLLQEYSPGEVEWNEDGVWTFGESRMHLDLGEDEIGAEVELDCAVPGTDSRLRGLVCAEGSRPRPGERGESDEPHVWVPLAVPAAGEMDLEVGDEASYRAEGRAYVDHNRGTRPLHDLGIRRWLWGRATVDRGELVFYRLEPEQGEVRAFGQLFRPDGEVEWMPELTLELDEASRNIGGLRWWRRWVVEGPEIPDVEIDCGDVVDSGPFYMRYLTRTTTDGETTPARGVSELIRPDRIDEGLFRPLVQMRVDRSHREGRGNSMWLPLFTGPKSGRFRRFLRQNTGGSW